LAKEKLSEYHKKRDFGKTVEPKGGKKKKSGKGPMFVIQKHDARSLHYDFRLEVDGVLKSWAVPKGPSTDPSVKRLAMPTEDHPIEYADFEGVIPEGQYGAGVVMVWDTGKYRNLKKKDGKEVPMEDAVENGHVEVWLEGEKLQGGYALIKTKRMMGDRESWLLIKMRDDEADARRNPTSTENKSVQSGLTMKQIEKEAEESD
jgi:DNA ligase D-like protein (predicted 3'-phosphoesterase)